MKKSHSILILALAIFQICPAKAEEIKALIDLEFLEDTEITSGVLCFGEEDCHRWSTYYLFTAHVLKTIEGQLSSDSFKVIFGSHALKKEDFPYVLATLEPMESGNQFSAQYKILNLDWNHGL